jgi:hypothetical protein
MGTLLAVGFLILVCLVLLFVLFSSNRKIKEEIGKIPLHQEKCNVAYKNDMIPVWAGGNIQAGRVAFYDTFLVVSFLGTTFIPYDDIESFEKSGPHIDIVRYNSKIKIKIFSNSMDKVLAILNGRALSGK